jgi:hypothetical protein
MGVFPEGDCIPFGGKRQKGSRAGHEMSNENVAGNHDYSPASQTRGRPSAGWSSWQMFHSVRSIAYRAHDGLLFRGFSVAPRHSVFVFHWRHVSRQEIAIRQWIRGARLVGTCQENIIVPVLVQALR